MTASLYWLAFCVSITIYVICINLLTFTLFALDKKRAIEGAWRVPERRLLFWAAVGGLPGAKFAQRLYKHKTSKRKFTARMDRISRAHTIVLALVWLPAVPMAF